MHADQNLSIDDLQRWIGREETHTDTLTSSLTKRFCATLGERFTDPGKNYSPPGLHWCLTLPTQSTGELAQDGHPHTGAFLPPVPLPRRMWASSKITFHRPLITDATTERHSRVASVTGKENASGEPLVFVEVEHTYSQARTVCIAETQTLVYRQAPDTKAATPQKEQPQDTPVARGGNALSITPSHTLLFRYSALTFNAHRIHYDHSYTTEVEGYPGLVVQGPLMATLLMNFAIRATDGATLKTFAFRGVAPAFVNEKLHLVASSTLETLAIYAPGKRLIMQASATFTD